MAHSCPDCNEVCYCGGDIDDALLEDPQHVQGCTHCSDLPQKEYDGDFDDDLLDQES